MLSLDNYYYHFAHFQSTKAIIHIFNNWYLVVESTHMQGGVSGSILGAHVSSVEQQVFQVLHMAVAACLKKNPNKPMFTYKDKRKRKEST